jgi:hypothetical protein
MSTHRTDAGSSVAVAINPADQTSSDGECRPTPPAPFVALSVVAITTVVRDGRPAPKGPRSAAALGGGLGR